MRRAAKTARARLVVVRAAIVMLAATATTAIAERAASAAQASAARQTARQATAASPAASAVAAAGDPLESAECRRALALLNGEETAVAEASRANGGVTANDRRVIDAKLAQARRQAAVACLARRADPAMLSSQRLVRPTPTPTVPLAVAPGPVPPPSTPTPRIAPLAPPAPPVERPYAITSCDAGGCWANDGSRLNRVGPNLYGPRGACTVQGSLVQCP